MVAASPPEVTRKETEESGQAKAQGHHMFPLVVKHCNENLSINGCLNRENHLYIGSVCMCLCVFSRRVLGIHRLKLRPACRVLACPA